MRGRVRELGCVTMDGGSRTIAVCYDGSTPIHTHPGLPSNNKQSRLFVDYTGGHWGTLREAVVNKRPIVSYTLRATPGGWRQNHSKRVIVVPTVAKPIVRVSKKEEGDKHFNMVGLPLFSNCTWVTDGIDVVGVHGVKSVKTTSREI